MTTARMTARELAASFDQSADWHRHFGPCAAAMIYRDAADQIREHLVPRYDPVSDDMPDGWYWCEELDPDAPPQKCAWHSCGVDSTGNDVSPSFKRWTIGGWASVTGRVCQISNRPA